MIDPDQISTAAHRVLSAANLAPLTGPIITSTDFQAMRELAGDGLSSSPEPCCKGYRSQITGNGIEMLKVMGVIR